MATPHRVLSLLTAASVLLAAAGAFAESGSPSPPAPSHAGGPPVLTRQVKRFVELERSLADALRRGDRAGAVALLTDDFEARPAGSPGTPVPREEWLAGTLGAKAEPEFSEVAVHAYEGVSVVSYRAAGVVRGGAMVVDVWIRDGDLWKLSVRYFGPN